LDVLRFGLLGFGSIGQVRAQALARTPQCRLTALYDTDPARRSRAPAGAQTFASNEEMLDADSCDAVIISTPPDSHADLATRAMRSGKHVIVEKPIAATLPAAAEMLRVAGETHRLLTVGFNHRYFKGIKRVHAAIHSGEIGELRYIKAYAGHVGLPELRSPWMYDRAVMGGGTLMDNGIHVIDLVRHLMGDIVEVRAALPAPIWDVGVEENAFVQLTGRNGVVGSLHSSWTAWQGYKFRIEAYGSSGMAMMSYAPMFSSVVRVQRSPAFSARRERNFYVADIFREKALGWQRTTIDTFIEEFGDFRALLADPAAAGRIATGTDGASAIAISHAAYESAATGSAVTPRIGAHGVAGGADEGKQVAVDE
jgi:predicted dehydrogenase